MKMDRRRCRRRRRCPTFIIIYNDITADSFTIDRCHILQISLILYAFRDCYNPNESTKCGPLVPLRHNGRAHLVYIPVLLFFELFHFCVTVAKCDQPLHALLTARNCQDSLSWLTSYKNVTTNCIACNCIAYWKSFSWKNEEKKMQKEIARAVKFHLCVQ